MRLWEATKSRTTSSSPMRYSIFLSSRRQRGNLRLASNWTWTRPTIGFNETFWKPLCWKWGLTAYGWGLLWGVWRLWSFRCYSMDVQENVLGRLVASGKGIHSPYIYSLSSAKSCPDYSSMHLRSDFLKESGLTPMTLDYLIYYLRMIPWFSCRIQGVIGRILIGYWRHLSCLGAEGQHSKIGGVLQC